MILCLSIGTLAYKSINISEQNKEILKEVHSSSQEVLELQNNKITPLYKVRELTQSLVMAPNKTLRIDIENNLNELIKALDVEFELFSKDKKTIVEMWSSYKILIQEIKNDLNEGFEEAAYINETTSSRQQFNILLKALLDIQTNSLNNSTLAYNNAVIQTKTIKIGTLTSIIFILLISTIIGWLISNNIVTSIYAVQNGLKDFFDYLNHKKKSVKKIEIKSKDEFHQMATIINQNVSITQNNIEQNIEFIKNATKVLENIEQGNLGTRISKDTNNEALNELKIVINNMIDNLEFKIQEEINKRLEQEQILIQQSKLASMGEMIGNIAHQWRQPLAQISAIHMNMKVTYDFDKFTKEYMESKIKEANKLTAYMSQTISDFQNFFKPQGEKEVFSIEKACRDAYFILESSLKAHGIKVIFHITQDVTINGYKTEYSQVILNLLSNAKDILIERQIKNPKIELEIKDGNHFALVKIKDNAGGVDTSIIDKIFEPYFTTRHQTQGTGIGLYMSKNIIERNMHGYINVVNVEDGALFTVKVDKEIKN
ncbi:sensor histidine kinase [Arcobacter caeni]|uniref:sensor histidine kinase n=1 Tax=Arcobacter caeni TaxID=1912877 RepID=UPI0013FE4D19|nr:ATP-binding protein [Arcobacter caeni]